MKRSLKKTLGTIGTLLFYTICGYGSYKDPSMIPSILWPLATYAAALFGIKKYGYKQDEK